MIWKDWAFNMKLNMICDGFSYRPSDSFRYDNLKHSDDVPQFIRQHGNFVYSDSDSVFDFVAVEPIMAVKTLPIKPVDKRSLKSFEGAQILYGFTIKNHNDYDDYDLVTQNPLYNEIKSYYDEIIELGFPPNDRDRRIKIDSIESLRDLSKRWHLALPKLERDYGDVTDEKRAINNIDIIIDQLGKNNVSSVSDLLVISNRTGNENKSRKDRTLNDLTLAFAKAIKNPGTEEEMNISIKFTELATKIFLEKSTTDYDIILYPSSTSPFNKEMADILGKGLGAVSMQIPKRKVKEVTFAVEELMKRAMNTKRDVDERLGRVPTEQEWVDREIKKLKNTLGNNQERIATIKGLFMGDKRRYAQLFKFENPELIKDASVLVVDDNVTHQGTFEMIHAMLVGFQPRHITLYAPLLLKSLHK